jgi:mRNA interferase YafQ
MRRLIFAGRFEKDTTRLKKRGYETSKLREVILRLAQGEILEKNYRDHPLKGNYKGFRECHLAPDWLLIYRWIGDDELEMARTGTHSDLFDE